MQNELLPAFPADVQYFCHFVQGTNLHLQYGFKVFCVVLLVHDFTT